MNNRVDIEAGYDILEKYISDPIKTQEFIRSLPTIFCRICGETNPDHGFDAMMSGLTSQNKPRYISPYKCNDCCNWQDAQGKFIGKAVRTIDPWERRYLD